MVPGDPDNCHTFIIKNDYKYDLVAAITYKYYGESGNLLNLDRVNFRYIKAGEYCVATMEKSHKPDNCREEFVLGCSIITSSQDELAANNPFFGFKVSALDSFEKDTSETNTYAKTVVFENTLREGWASYFLGRYYVFDPNANYIGTASFKNCDGEHPPYVIPPHEKVKYKLVVTLNNGCNINDAVILSQNGYNIPMIK